MLKAFKRITDMFPKIKIYQLPWKVFNFTKLKGKMIFDMGNIAVWVIWSPRNSNDIIIK